MKLYKKILKAFGGAALYLDKSILKALKVATGDEVIVEIQENRVIITKPILDANKIKELLDANEKSKKGI